jgi:hypothetical protein
MAKEDDGTRKNSREDGGSPRFCFGKPVSGGGKVLDPALQARVHRQIADGEPDIDDMMSVPGRKPSTDAWRK